MVNSDIQVHPVLAPPWNTVKAWHEANHSVRYHIRRHRAQMHYLEPVFLDVKAGMVSIFPILRDLCENTCPWCPEPCCLAATVWFDLPDLLFLHLNHCTPPPSQPKMDLKAACRYLGPKGCRLPRISRPWICTWYLCDSQLTRLRKNGKAAADTFAESLQSVKKGRKDMESEFIRIVAQTDPYPYQWRWKS